MRKSFKYKAKLSPSAVRNAERQLELLRQLYNAALQERREAWEKEGRHVTYVDQTKQLTEIRAMLPEYAALDLHMTRSALSRLDRAYKAFFGRVKRGEEPGYPRFKGKSRYTSTTYQGRGWKLNGRRLTMAGIGTVRLFLSRPVEGTIKTVTLARDRCGDWWVTFACEGIERKPLEETGLAVGIDLGLQVFLATSDGESIANPRHLRRAEAVLKRSARRVSNRKKGGKRRRKAAVTLARRHRRVANARRDFHFKTALHLVRRYDTVAVEDLNVRGLARGMLAKSVNDAAWGQFISILRFKAEEAGRALIEVNPTNTSQVCSGCGHQPEKRKSLSVRVHQCEKCGLRLDRDVNAAINILTLAKRGGERPSASRPARKAAA